MTLDLGELFWARPSSSKVGTELVQKLELSGVQKLELSGKIVFEKNAGMLFIFFWPGMLSSEKLQVCSSSVRWQPLNSGQCQSSSQL